jgi:hypothetical protein
MEFQAPQPGQRPIHLRSCLPHSLHMKITSVFMACLINDFGGKVKPLKKGGKGKKMWGETLLQMDYCISSVIGGENSYTIAENT